VEGVERAREAIAAAAARAGRAPEDVQMLAAVKYLDVSQLPLLIEAGVTLMGENRAQALVEKAAAQPGVRWHFIGRLQSRKVKQVLPHVELIHSVASDSVLRELGRHGDAATEVLIEVNVAGEEGKEGVLPEDLDSFISRCPARVVGLMTMPPLAADPEASRPHFARLAGLARERGLAHLSMGTSQDFTVAVEEGATIVRLGSTLLQGTPGFSRS
jgi:pyridoxal phosphate enzyme (YggS family)